MQSQYPAWVTSGQWGEPSSAGGSRIPDGDGSLIDPSSAGIPWGAADPRADHVPPGPWDSDTPRWHPYDQPPTDHKGELAPEPGPSNFVGKSALNVSDYGPMGATMGWQDISIPLELGCMTGHASHHGPPHIAATTTYSSQLTGDATRPESVNDTYNTAYAPYGNNTSVYSIGDPRPLPQLRPSPSQLSAVKIEASDDANMLLYPISEPRPPSSRRAPLCNEIRRMAEDSRDQCIGSIVSDFRSSWPLYELAPAHVNSLRESLAAALNENPLQELYDRDSAYQGGSNRYGMHAVRVHHKYTPGYQHHTRFTVTLDARLSHASPQTAAQTDADSSAQRCLPSRLMIDSAEYTVQIQQQPSGAFQWQVVNGHPWTVGSKSAGLS